MHRHRRARGRRIAGRAGPARDLLESPLGRVGLAIPPLAVHRPDRDAAPRLDGGCAGAPGRFKLIRGGGLQRSRLPWCLLIRSSSRACQGAVVSARRGSGISRLCVGAFCTNRSHPPRRRVPTTSSPPTGSRIAKRHDGCETQPAAATALPASAVLHPRCRRVLLDGTKW